MNMKKRKGKNNLPKQWIKLLMHAMHWSRDAISFNAMNKTLIILKNEENKLCKRIRGEVLCFSVYAFLQK